MSNYIYKYKVTIKQQMIILARLFILDIALIIACIYFLKISLTSITFIIGFSFFLLTDTIPTIILHTQYWLKNHKATFTINTEMKELTYATPGNQLRYSFSDIDRLQYNWNFGKGSGWYSFGEYRYYKIIFKDKTEVVITCLMINDIENTLEMLLKMKAERHGKYLCLIK